MVINRVFSEDTDSNTQVLSFINPELNEIIIYTLELEAFDRVLRYNHNNFTEVPYAIDSPLQESQQLHLSSLGNS